jgi:lipid-A-disaccharide synthase
MLPMNAPERIPLEGAGHWLGLLPGIGPILKRWAVRAFVEGLDQPVSLPNRISGERLFEEVTGRIGPDEVAERAAALLGDPSDLARRRARLRTTMPAPGAAARLADRVVARLAEGGP